MHDSLPSTNERLLNTSVPLPDGKLSVCLASHQSAGKGRDGKSWHSPPGAGLLLSVGRAMPQPPDSSLALALGVAAAEALEDFVAVRVHLKWPNDLVAVDRKLGGILVESASRGGAGQTLIVAGVGVNMRVTEQQQRRIAEEGGMAAAALEEWPGKHPLEHHALAASVIGAFAEVLQRYPQERFAPWIQDWRQRDWLKGRRIEAHQGAQVQRGMAAGVDADGALLLKQPAGKHRILSAEIRV
ncbi:biotin--[acetyl-CoA-carboxylase] ligase [Candidatus Foliamicus sp.]